MALATHGSRVGHRPAAVLAAAVLAIPALRYLRETPPVSDAVQFNIPPPENTRFGGPESGGTGTATQLAVSPDGRHVVFVATGEGGYQLWVRSIGAVAARPLPGTEDGILSLLVTRQPTCRILRSAEN